MKTVVTFGEIMLRLSTPGFLRFCQAPTLEVNFGGAESNVAAALANFGIPTEYITRLPANDIGKTCLMYLRKHGVGTSHIVWGGDRLGVYYLETGSVQRGSKVIYDRARSAIAEIESGMVNWKEVFKNADWFHVTGITPAISAGAAQVSIEAARTAKEMGLTVSCDLNYRKKLWKWGKDVSEVMPELVSYCDLVIANEEDVEKVFGIKAPGVDILSGGVTADAYRFVCEELAKRVPTLKTIAITLRGSISASHNTWSAALWQEGQFYTAPKYDITHIVDRVGGGDTFGGSLIYGIKTNMDIQTALNFAVAASCLKHSIWGDANLASLEEVEKLMKGDASGRVSR